MLPKSRMNFVLGPTKSGKTTFCHFLTESILKIKKSRMGFNIETSTQTPDREIGNKAESVTKVPQYYEEFCDIPGFGDTRGEEYNLNNLIELQSELQNFEHIRLILLIEKKSISSGNGAHFTNILTEFVNLFELTKEEVKNIIIVVSKSDENFCEEIPDILIEMSTQESNLIIEAIKMREIKILSFAKPEKIGSEFQIHETKRALLIQEINNTDYLDCSNFRERIYKKIETKLLMIRQEYEKYPNILFSSKIRITERLCSNYILCIDNDVTLNQDTLIISAPIILVLSEGSKKNYWKIEGKVKYVNFNPEIRKVINGEKWEISTVNLNDTIEFPNPTSNNFPSSWQFFRLESICVNGNWTEYATHNNKFIELIVYINPSLGVINVNPNFKIKTHTTDLRLKLYINECMRTKNTIMKNYLSIRMCKDIDEYLEKCKKTNISTTLNYILHHHITKLPSIFQLLMNTQILSNFSGKQSEMNDLLNIRVILIQNYLKLMKDFFLNSNTQLTYNDELFEAYRSFWNFCDRKLGPGYGEISEKNHKLLEGLKTALNFNLHNEEILDFYRFFDTLSISEKKMELFRYGVTGDISRYSNFQSLINKKIGRTMDITEFKAYYSNPENEPLIGGRLSYGVSAGKFIIVKSATSVTIEAGIGISTTVGFALSAGFILVGDVGLNLACSYLKSGYYKGEFIPDPKSYILDLI